MDSHSFIFVTGLHRSGTSPLHRCLRSHPQVSGFHNTGVSEDEGQHLQTVLPRGGAYGGPGRFGRHPEAHMTEEHPAANAQTAAALFAQWSPYWDLSKPYLVEKTPINLTRTRLFQALFPGAHFIVLIRHPAAVALATYNAYASFGKVPDTTITNLIEHWVLCYETFLEDAPYLQQRILIRYEDFAQRPQETLDGIYDSLGLPHHSCDEAIHPHSDRLYQEQWRAMSRDPRHQEDIERASRFEERIQRFGYSLREWSESESPAESLPVIETERLALRPFTFDDVDSLAALCADPETMRFWGGVQLREQVWGEILHYRRAYEQTSYSFWAIVDRDQGRLIGRCGIEPQEINGRQEMELGCQIARPYWGHGRGTEAAIAVTEYVFARSSFRRLISIIDPANIASIRVAQKNGMRYETDTDNDGHLLHVYAIHKSEPAITE